MEKEGYSFDKVVSMPDKYLKEYARLEALESLEDAYSDLISDVEVRAYIFLWIDKLSKKGCIRNMKITDKDDDTWSTQIAYSGLGVIFSRCDGLYIHNVNGLQIFSIPR